MADKQTVEEILRNRVKFIGDGEWTLLGTPEDVIKELNQLLIKERIDELEKAKKKYNSLSTQHYIEERIANLENQLGEKS